ncbi:hypothetical protein [Paenibacillus wenxiniae]|uniref:S-layer homology domain-containing protein n=1 Tax=Paenibacillus wenxiniae TaxID=1636843 RepID=A0ABW4RPQ9_9BACL
MNHDDLTHPSATNTFQPDTPLIYATAIPLLVEQLGLNTNKLRFIKAPQASDYFTMIDNNAPYSQQMLVASLNGLPLSPELNPAAMMPRADFAVLLWHAVEQHDSQQTQAFNIADDHQAAELVSADDTEANHDKAQSATHSESSAASTHQHHSSSLESIEQVKCSTNLKLSEHSDLYVFQQLTDCGLIPSDDKNNIELDKPITYAEATAMLEHAQSLMNPNAK